MKGSINLTLYQKDRTLQTIASRKDTADHLYTTCCRDKNCCEASWQLYQFIAQSGSAQGM